MIDAREHMHVFLQALDEANGEEWCRPPGMGLLKVRQLRDGLERGAVVLHAGGTCFALVNYPQHRYGPCACPTCQWQLSLRLEDERSRKR